MKLPRKRNPSGNFQNITQLITIRGIDHFLHSTNTSKEVLCVKTGKNHSTLRGKNRCQHPSYELIDSLGAAKKQAPFCWQSLLLHPICIGVSRNAGYTSFVTPGVATTYLPSASGTVGGAASHVYSAGDSVSVLAIASSHVIAAPV